MSRIRFQAPSLSMAVSLLALVIAMGGTAVAVAPTVVNLADATTPANKAHVDTTGHLLVGDGSGALTVNGTVQSNIADATTPANKAHVDTTGHLLVGDGSGALTVNGTVQSVTPTATWHFTTTYSATYYDITPPSALGVNVGTLFLGGDSTTTYAFLGIYAATVPSTASDCRASSQSSELIWQGQAQASPDSVSVSFPVPLRVAPVAGKKVCLWAYLNHQGNAIVSMNGYYS
jgi:hypothetical protein